MPAPELETLVDAFAGLEVLVVGDALLDAWLHGAAPRLAREAPVPVVDVARRDDVPGGAANVAANAAALGARVSLAGVVGADRAGDDLLDGLARLGVDVSRVERPAGRTTQVKHRLVADGQIVVRFDEGSDEPLDETVEEALADRVAAAAASADVVLCAEYGGGSLPARVRAALATVAAERSDLVVLADGRDPTVLRELRPTVATPNWEEAVRLLGYEPEGERAVAVAGAADQILARTGARIVAVTLDSDGAVLLEAGRPAHRTYAARVEGEASCSGAGDTWAAAFALALAAGAETTTSAEIAAAAAAVAVAKPGTALCTGSELRHALLPPGKVVPDAGALTSLARRLRAEGRTIAFSNGCFDILHRGHVNFLSEAKALADVLVVGVNSDASVARLKGPERPLNGLADRLEVLAGLSCVDHLAAFDADRPEDLIRALEPDLYVKGGDYTPATLPEALLVESLGGEVRILGYLADRSTTRLVERVRARR